MVIAERLRWSVDMAPLPVGDVLLGITISIGAAAGVEEPEPLIEAADRRLHRAKEAGRNRAVADDDTTVRGNGAVALPRGRPVSYVPSVSR